MNQTTFLAVLGRLRPCTWSHTEYTSERIAETWSSNGVSANSSGSSKASLLTSSTNGRQRAAEMFQDGTGAKLSTVFAGSRVTTTLIVL
ncbi:GM16097 [Drosophila sechellia]|uniref:GM16097 n=1 Tax=Drosophila sechellia TaxID=7238 RepID=B4IPR2_DROSE|nr:GM16097 [Drosophila sechellia]